MIFVVKKEFSKKLNTLFKKYNHVLEDFEDFKINFKINEVKHLGKGIYKCRMKNSSIPTGKSGGFRIILLINTLKSKVLPFIIYSKRDTESISLKEIKNELKKYIS